MQLFVEGEMKSGLLVPSYVFTDQFDLSPPPELLNFL